MMDKIERVQFNSDIKKIIIPSKLLSSSKVSNIIRILGEVEKKYFRHPRNFSIYHIERAQPDNKYFKYFIGISDYLEDLREVNRSNLPMDMIIMDYFSSIYVYYARYDRKPFFNQIAASTTNRIKFDEWIADWEKQSGDKYWKVQKNISVISIKEEARNIIEKQKSDRADVEIIDVEFLDV